MHLTLRYLIVNTVYSLKHFLSIESKYNIDSKLEFEKTQHLKEYSIFLYHILDILFILLRNLLSSHVDNYRDDLVIENLVYLLLEVINFLYEIYELNCLSFKSFFITEYIQKLLEKGLEVFKEICKFNTTIKRNFEKILEKIAEKPSYKGAMLYLLTFIISSVNNEYTLEDFVEIFKKIQKVPNVDILYELETNVRNQVVRIGNFCDGKNFLEYCVEIAIYSNNQWIVKNIANFFIMLLKSNINQTKEKLYDKIYEYLYTSLISAFNNVNKIELKLVEDKVKILFFYITLLL